MKMLMEDWLRGCVFHDGRFGEVTLPTDKVIEIANYIQATRTGIDGDGMVYFPSNEESRTMTRQEAVKWLSNLKMDIGKTQHQELWHYEQALDEIMQALKQEPKRGKWLDYLEEGLKWECSECGSKFTTPWHYCPNCGARMESDE